jgi:hypothetical protein
MVQAGGGVRKQMQLRAMQAPHEAEKSLVNLPCRYY